MSCSAAQSCSSGLFFFLPEKLGFLKGHGPQMGQKDGTICLVHEPGGTRVLWLCLLQGPQAEGLCAESGP